MTNSYVFNAKLYIVDGQHTFFHSVVTRDSFDDMLDAAIDKVCALEAEGNIVDFKLDVTNNM